MFPVSHEDEGMTGRRKRGRQKGTKRGRKEGGGVSVGFSVGVERKEVAGGRVEDKANQGTSLTPYTRESERVKHSPVQRKASRKSMSVPGGHRSVWDDRGASCRGHVSWMQQLRCITSGRPIIFYKHTTLWLNNNFTRSKYEFLPFSQKCKKYEQFLGILHL